MEAAKRKRGKSGADRARRWKPLEVVVSRGFLAGAARIYAGSRATDQSNSPRRIPRHRGGGLSGTDLHQTVWMIPRNPPFPHNMKRINNTIY